MAGNLNGLDLTLLLLPSVQAADPPTACHTPLGVPCHVIEYEWTQWVTI